jgi:hypothetical protein
MLANGHFQLAADGNTTYGASASVSCNIGYIAMVQQVTCKATGLWENAQCVPVG